MRRLIPGLVICALLAAVGSGVMVFSGPDLETNIWDVALVVSTLAFLVFFVMLLAGKAAAAVAEDVEPAGVPTEEPRMSGVSRTSQPDDIPEPETIDDATTRRRRAESSAPRKDRHHENEEQPTDTGLHRGAP